MPRVFLNRSLITSIRKDGYGLIIDTSAFNRYLWLPDYNRPIRIDIARSIKYAPKMFKYDKRIDAMRCKIDNAECYRHFPEGSINGVYITSGSLFVKLGRIILESYSDQWQPIKEELARCKRNDINPTFEIVDHKRVDLVCGNAKYMLVEYSG